MGQELDPKPRILIYGFEGKNFEDKANISEFTLEKLKTAYPNAEIKTLLLPTDYKQIDKIFGNEINAFSPDYIVGTGEFNITLEDIPTSTTPLNSSPEAPSHALFPPREIPSPMPEREEWQTHNAEKEHAILVEKNAHNHYTKDLGGSNIVRVDENGPESFSGANSVELIEPGVFSTLSTNFSNCAGNGPCNYSYFKSLQYMNTNGTPGNAVFIHLEDYIAAEREIPAYETYWDALCKIDENLATLDLGEMAQKYWGNMQDDLLLIYEDLDGRPLSEADTGTKQDFYDLHANDLFTVIHFSEQNIREDLNLSLARHHLDKTAGFEKDYDKLAEDYAEIIDNYIENIANALDSDATPTLVSQVRIE